MSSCRAATVMSNPTVRIYWRAPMRTLTNGFMVGLALVMFVYAQPPQDSKEEGRAVQAAPQGGMREPGRSSPPFRGGPDFLAESGLKSGDALPDLTGYDSNGKEFRLRGLKGHYTVLVFGCLT